MSFWPLCNVYSRGAHCRVDFWVHAFLLLRLYIVCSGLRLAASRQGREMTPERDFPVVPGLHFLADRVARAGDGERRPAMTKFDPPTPRAPMGALMPTVLGGLAEFEWEPIAPELAKARLAPSRVA
jgi:hypothetical protein